MFPLQTVRNIRSNGKHRSLTVGEHARTVVAARAQKHPVCGLPEREPLGGHAHALVDERRGKTPAPPAPAPAPLARVNQLATSLSQGPERALLGCCLLQAHASSRCASSAAAATARPVLPVASPTVDWGESAPRRRCRLTRAWLSLLRAPPPPPSRSLMCLSRGPRAALGALWRVRPWLDSAGSGRPVLARAGGLCKFNGHHRNAACDCDYIARARALTDELFFA